MDAEQAARVLKDKTGLEVADHAIAHAIASQPGDVEAAVKATIDLWATGENRTKAAGTLLLAALRSQARGYGQRTQTEKNAAIWERAQAFHQRHMPSLPEPFVVGAFLALRRNGQDPEPGEVRAKVEAGYDCGPIERAA